MTAGLRSLALRSLHRQFEAADERRRTIGTIAPTEWPDRQLHALRAVWRDAVADVPYYAALVADGQAPRTIESWDDVRAIPVLTRRDLQDRPDDFVRRSGPPASFIKTAGSTGVPIRVGMNAAERDLMRIIKVSAWQEFGYTLDSRLFLIWGHAHLLGTGWRGRVNHAKRRLTDAVLGYRRVDAYRLSPAICQSYAEDLIRFQPIGLVGYAAALDLFARHTAAYRDRFRALGVKFVLSTAEAPPRADSVARLEDLFACPVVQEYGGAEFGQVAFKRGAEPFLVYPDLAYLEAESSEAGDHAAQPLLVTSLYPRYVPLLRYRVGDEAVAPDRLPNGHVWRFAEMAGRINDVILFPDGQSVHSVALFHCIHQEPAVHAIQVVLDDAGIEVVLVVVSAGDHAEMEQRIRRRLVQVHPALGEARFLYDTDLQTNRAGKRRWFIDRRSSAPCVASPAS